GAERLRLRLPAGRGGARARSRGRARLRDAGGALLRHRHRARRRLRPVPDRERAPVIPRVFHQVWVGPEPLPDEYRRYQQTWLQHTPGWALEVWTDETLPEGFQREEVYDLLRQPAERSDMLIFEILYRFGGVYTDTDFECLRPIEPMLRGVEIFCAYSHPDRLNNAIMGSVAGHPIIEEGIKGLRPRATYGTVDKAGTGP